MKKRILSLLAACALVLTGCGGSVQVDDYATNEGYETVAEADTSGGGDLSQNDSEESDGIAVSDMKIGVLYLTNPAEGNGYDFTHDLGIQGMQKNLGLSDNQIIRKVNVDDSNKEATENAIQECLDEGCNMIFTTSWGYMEATSEMAEENPDVYFCHGTGYMSNGKNFVNYFGRIYQARYLSGLVAGLNTKSNKIGYVAAQDSTNSEVTGGIDAFAIGVDKVNPDAEIYVVVTNSWYDPEGEAAAAQKLLDMGCDVMAQHCDTAFPQTMAQEKGVFGIGYNSDMSKETPDSCLTSVIWNWSAYYTAAVQSVIDGTWNGENYYGGMAEGLVDVTNLADFCVDGTKELVEQERGAILSGESNVFDGVMETNAGEKIGTEGGTLDDATITGGINWYYKNVVVVQ